MIDLRLIVWKNDNISKGKRNREDPSNEQAATPPPAEDTGNVGI